MDQIPTLIVEDELIESEGLKVILKEIPQVLVIGCARNVAEAVEIVNKRVPEMIFLDIELGKESGFEILDRVISCDYKPCVICTTGFETYALRGIKYSVFDFLIKPIIEPDLVLTVKRYLQVRRELQVSQKLDTLLSLNNPCKKMKIRSTKGFILVSPAEIFYCKADWNYTEIYFTKGKKEVVSLNLGKMTELLNPNSFFRINRSTLINLHYLTHVNRVERKCHLNKNGEEIFFSIPVVHIKELERIYPFPI